MKPCSRGLSVSRELFGLWADVAEAALPSVKLIVVFCVWGNVCIIWSHCYYLCACSFTSCPFYRGNLMLIHTCKGGVAPRSEKCSTQVWKVQHTGVKDAALRCGRCSTQVWKMQHPGVLAMASLSVHAVNKQHAQTWNSLQQHGTPWNNTEQHRTPWNKWNPLKHPEISLFYWRCNAVCLFLTLYFLYYLLNKCRVAFFFSFANVNNYRQISHYCLLYNFLTLVQYSCQTHRENIFMTFTENINFTSGVNITVITLAHNVIQQCSYITYNE